MVPEKAIRNWCLLKSGSPCMVKLPYAQSLDGNRPEPRIDFQHFFFTAGIPNLKNQIAHLDSSLSQFTFVKSKDCFQIICTLRIWHVLPILYAVYSWTSRMADIETTNWRSCGRAIVSGVSWVDLWLKNM